MSTDRRILNERASLKDGYLSPIDDEVTIDDPSKDEEDNSKKRKKSEPNPNSKKSTRGRAVANLSKSGVDESVGMDDSDPDTPLAKRQTLDSGGSIRSGDIRSGGYSSGTPGSSKSASTPATPLKSPKSSKPQLVVTRSIPQQPAPVPRLPQQVRLPSTAIETPTSSVDGTDTTGCIYPGLLENVSPDVLQLEEETFSRLSESVCEMTAPFDFDKLTIWPELELAGYLENLYKMWTPLDLKDHAASHRMVARNLRIPMDKPINPDDVEKAMDQVRVLPPPYTERYIGCPN